MTTTDIEGLDRTMNRASCFGLGFMTGLEAHGFGTWIEPEAFGHSGLGGMTFGFCLPADGVSVAVHTNGLVDAPEVVERRIEIVDALIADLGESRGVVDTERMLSRSLTEPAG
jgi:CubicO group peptidase (beta-lactamase class C family)